MKKIMLFLITFLIASAGLIAQPANINSIFQKYSGEEAFTMMSLNDASPLLKDMGGDAKAQEALKTVKQLKVLTFDAKKGKNATKGKQFTSEVRNTIPTDFDEIMSLQKGSVKTKMYAKIDGKSTSEFLMLVSDNISDGMIIYLSGDFTMQQIRNVAKMLEKDRESKGK